MLDPSGIFNPHGVLQAFGSMFVFPHVCDVELFSRKNEMTLSSSVVNLTRSRISHTITPSWMINLRISLISHH